MKEQQPPKWCSNAVPTIYGWADPKTGELLVSKRGLKNPIQNYKRNRPIQVQPIPEPAPNALRELEPPTEIYTDESTVTVNGITFNCDQNGRPLRPFKRPKKVEQEAYKIALENYEKSLN